MGAAQGKQGPQGPEGPPGRDGVNAQTCDSACVIDVSNQLDVNDLVLKKSDQLTQSNMPPSICAGSGATQMCLSEDSSDSTKGKICWGTPSTATCLTMDDLTTLKSYVADGVVVKYDDEVSVYDHPTNMYGSPGAGYIETGAGIIRKYNTCANSDYYYNTDSKQCLKNT